MAYTITIETQSENDFVLLKDLAQRLGLRMKEGHSGGPSLEKPDQRVLAKQVLALRERFKQVKVDPDLDFSALADEMLGE